MVSKMSSPSGVSRAGHSGQIPGSDLLRSLDTESRTAAIWGFLGLVAYASARTLVYAGMKPLSNDEVLTQAVCHQATIRGIWKALNQGVDGQPPLFYVIERNTAWLIHNEHIGYRILPMLGFVCTLILLYVFVKTRNGVACALACASLLLLTPLFTIYAAEARPYTPLTACIAIAMVCYQRAGAALWVSGMFFSLFLATSLHYFAVFALFPFFVAELMVVFKTKKMRVWVWLALLLPLASLGMYWQLLMRMNHHWWGAIYAHVSSRALAWTYAGFMGVLPAWGAALVGAAIVAVLVESFSMASHPGHPKGFAKASAPERVMILGLIILPMLGFAATKITHAPFVDRYFLPTILGIAAAAGCALGLAKPKSITMATAFVMLAIAVQELGFWTSPRHWVVPATEVSPLASLAAVAHHEDLPIAVSDPAAYVVYWHYASPVLRGRIMGLADPAAAMIYTGTGVRDELLVALRSYEPVAVPDWSSFAAGHPVFLLYGSQSDWWPGRLVHDGYRLQVLVARGGDAMYLVESKAVAPW
jgi:4-amino-4-deoxy-L-arabinose transferase-like glycosyltransferase